MLDGAQGFAPPSSHSRVPASGTTITMMTAAILCIGTELTRGEIVDTNSTWLADGLTGLGHEVLAIDAVPDDRRLIIAALERLGAGHDLLVCTGGLGPTTDDITSECVAAALGVVLQRDDASLRAIRERMERFGRAMAESNAKQADFPVGAEVLANPHGTAPGFSVRLGRSQAFFMPGVPREMKPMFDTFVAPKARTFARAGIHQIRLKTFGMPESAVNDRLAGIEAAYDVVLAYRAHFPEIEVKVLARAANDAVAARKARSAADEVSARLGDIVYAEGETTLAESVGKLLEERALSLGTAESCTGGLVAELVTDVPGSSAYFKGSVVTYSNESKQRLLDVDAGTLATHGAVSAEVAISMAKGALRRLEVDVALSLTGIAGPSGGTPQKPVGLVHFAVATRDGLTARQVSFPTTRPQVRRLAAFAGLGLVRKILLQGHD